VQRGNREHVNPLNTPAWVTTIEHARVDYAWPWRTSKIREREKLIKVISSIAFIVAIAFVVRAAFLYYYFHFVVGRTFQSDEPFGYETGTIAAAIAQGRGFSSPLKGVQTGPTAWLTPIYPYLLAAIFKFFGVYSYTSHIVICCVNNAFSAFTCWPIYNIGERAFSKQVGAAAAWSWVAFPMSLFFSTVWVWDTALSALMVALIVAATLKMRGSKQLSCWAAYGALCETGAMVNASALSLLLPLAIWAVWPLRREPLLAMRVAAASIVFTIGITPWTVRNYVVFNKIIPFRSNFGLELWLGNNPLVPDLWSPTLHPNNSATEAI
jgi:Gpi18-like mannosyltransferase